MKTRYIVTEVSGRRLPWRVHAPTQNPRIAGEGAFATKGEADEMAASLNRPVRGLPLTVRGIDTLRRRLGERL